MKKKLFWFLALAACAALWYIPESVLYRENIYRLEPISGLRLTPTQAEQHLDVVRTRIEAMAEKPVLDAREVYEIDESLQKIQLGVTFPPTHYQHGILCYRDESEVGDEVYWGTSNLQFELVDLKKTLGWSSAQESAYQNLKTRPEAWNLWHPQTKRYPMTRYLHGLIRSRMFAVGAGLALLIFWKCSRVAWVLRRLFNRQTLQFAGYLLSFAISLGASPALAQQLLAKFKKNKTASEETIEPPDHSSLPASDPANLLSVEVFGDFTHDRQQFLTFSHQISRRVSLVLFNQERESAASPGYLSYSGIGAAVQVAKPLSVTAHTGPQFEFSGRNRLNQQTAFVNFAWRSRLASVTVINRLSRGLTEEVVPAHRHIVSIRAGPMPEWLSARGEFKQAGQGEWTENFWGPMVNYGKLLPERVRPWLSGLYAWPHYDFTKGSWDVRLGYVWSATF